MLKLIFNAFSLQKNSLRRPTFKRILVVFIVLPLLIFYVAITHLFLFLDKIFFPKFNLKSTEKAVFIVGVPRSGTSFLLNLVANDKANFTAFQLWELVLAPSIIQKYFWLGIGGFLSKVKFPFQRILSFMDKIFFKKMKGIHDLGLQHFEEDEMVYLYLFQSVYLMFIFPELEDIHQLLYTDNSDNLNKRIKQQIFYKSLIKRHLYVFNKHNDKYFLSKNPIHAIRLESLTTVFPKAKHLLLQRPLEKTIPSTISLNENLYSFFCTLPVPVAAASAAESVENTAAKAAATIRQKTIKMLIEWHHFIQDFDRKSDWQRLEIDFKNMVKSPSSEAEKIHGWLALSMDENYKNYLRKQETFSKNYKSRHTYEALTDEEVLWLEAWMKTYEVLKTS
jgi:hypothetical protein